MRRTYAIGDLHGRYDLLDAALQRIEASPSGGRVVFTGDYVDRGPQSREIIERLMAGPTKPGWEWVCLKGNHEDMMVGALRGEYEMGWWIGNGGSHTLASYPECEAPESHLAWMAALKLCFVDGHRVFVHAGIDETVPFDEQTEKTMLWSRAGKLRDYTCRLGYVVHGHTPFDDGPIVLAGRINIDTGAFYSGKLAVAVFDNDKPGPPVETFIVTVPA